MKNRGGIMFFVFLGLILSVLLVPNARANAFTETISSAYNSMIDWITSFFTGIKVLEDAHLLDANKNYVSDIYNQIKSQDNKWETIPADNWIWMKFDQNLTNCGHLFIYGKAKNKTKVELYQEGEEKPFAYFYMNEEKLYDIKLNTIREGSNILYLKTSGEIKVDYIFDPNPTCSGTYLGQAGTGAICHTCSNPCNCYYQCDGSESCGGLTGIYHECFWDGGQCVGGSECDVPGAQNDSFAGINNPPYYYNTTTNISRGYSYVGELVNVSGLVKDLETNVSTAWVNSYSEINYTGENNFSGIKTGYQNFGRNYYAAQTFTAISEDNIYGACVNITRNYALTSANNLTISIRQIILGGVYGSDLVSAKVLNTAISNSSYNLTCVNFTSVYKPSAGTTYGLVISSPSSTGDSAYSVAIDNSTGTDGMYKRYYAGYTYDYPAEDMQYFIILYGTFDIATDYFTINGNDKSVSKVIRTPFAGINSYDFCANDTTGLEKCYTYYINTQNETPASQGYTPNGQIISLPNNTKINGVNTLTFNVYENSNQVCEQEYANVSTACGGLSTGNYATTGSWNNVRKLYDGEYWTYTYPYINDSSLLINYTKPSNATNLSKLYYKGGFTEKELDIPQTCWAYNETKISFRITSSYYILIKNSSVYCFNGSGWVNMYFANGTSGFYGVFYEERMNWRIPSPDKTILQNISVWFKNSSDTTYNTLEACSSVDLITQECELDIRNTTKFTENVSYNFQLRACDIYGICNNSIDVKTYRVDNGAPSIKNLKIIYSNNATSAKAGAVINFYINASDNSTLINNSWINTGEINGSSFNLNNISGTNRVGEWSYWNAAVTVNYTENQIPAIIPFYFNDSASPQNERDSGFAVYIDNSFPNYSNQIINPSVIYNNDIVSFKIDVTDNYRLKKATLNLYYANWTRPPNLINASKNNGGFETAGAGGADVFANWGEQAGNGKIVRDTVDYYEGSASVRFDTNTTNQYMYQDVLPASPNNYKRYRYSFAAKTNTTNAYVRVYSGTEYTRHNLSSNWQNFSGEFSNAYTRLYLDPETVINVTLWIDNFEIEEAFISNITLNGTSATATRSMRLKTANYTFNFTLYDDAGNTIQSARQNFSVLGNENPINISLISPANSAIMKNPINFSFNITGDNATICEVNYDGNILGNITNVAANQLKSLSINSSENYGDWWITCDNADGKTYTSNTYNLTIDLTNPNVSYFNPANNIYINSSLYNFTANITDNQEVNNATISIYNSSGSLFNKTTTMILAPIYFIGTLIGNFIDGIYTYFWEIYDTAGNYFRGENYTLTVDTTYSNINFVSPTPDSGTLTVNRSFIINISINELNLANLTYNWNGTNYPVYDNSLLLMYNLDNKSSLGESSTEVFDLSQYGNNGTANAVWTSSGKYGGAFQFNATAGQGIVVNTNNDSFNINDSTTASLTITAWVKHLTTPSEKNIVSKAPGGIGNNKGWLFYFSGSSFGVTYNNGSASGQWVGSAAVTADTWTHLSAVFNSTGIALYINGVLKNNHVYNRTGSFANSNAVTIGKRGSTTGTFNGTIDEVRIWNRSLSADEVNQMYNRNLQKYNSTQWYLYVNQSKNSTMGLTTGNYTYQAFTTDLAGNINQTEQRSYEVDISPPNCTLLSKTPSDILDNSTGILSIILNCTDRAGINITKIGDHYPFFITRSVDVFISSAGIPNYWSTRYPNNSLAVTGNLTPLYKIWRALGRNEGYWYENLTESGLSDCSGLSPCYAPLNDTFSYAIEDGNYGHFTVTAVDSTNTSVIINYTHPAVDISAFRQSVYLSYENMVNEAKKNFTIRNNAWVLTKRFDAEAYGNTSNYTMNSFRNFGMEDTPTKTLRIYYCNSSIENSSGGIPNGFTAISNSNCNLINSLTSTEINNRVFTDINSSYSKSAYGIINGKFAGITATREFYIMYESPETGANKGYNIRYVNGSTNTDIGFNETRTAWTSTNQGGVWAQTSWTPDVFTTQTRAVNDQFQSGYYITDMLGNTGWNFTLIQDDIASTNHPISYPLILEYNGTLNQNDTNLNLTQKGTIQIKVGCAIDPDSIGNVTHNLTLRNEDGTYNYTVNGSFRCPNDLNVWISFDTSAAASGRYRMNITAISGDNSADIKSRLTDKNFTIDNSPPYFTAIPNNSSLIYGKDGLSAAFNASDTLNPPVTYSINWTEKFQIDSLGVLTNTTTLSGGEYLIKVMVNDSINNQNSTIYKVIVNQTSMNLSISGTTPINYGTTTDVVGSNCPSQLTCTLSPSNGVYGAGTKTFNYSTIGNENYSSSSITKNILINKIASSIYLYLDGLRQSKTIHAYSTLNSTAVINTGNNIDIELYVAGTGYIGASPLENLSKFSTAGLYNITAIYPSSENYTSSFERQYVTVISNESQSKCNITSGTYTNQHGSEKMYNKLCNSIDFGVVYTIKRGSDISINIPIIENDNKKMVGGYCEISLDYPNGTAFIVNQPMNVFDGYASYSFEMIDSSGELRGDIYCNNGKDTGISLFGIESTATGSGFSTAKAVIYIVILIVSILIFGGFLVIGFSVPYKNKTDEMTGYVIALSNLKYVKIGAFAFAYLAAMFISYFSWMICFAYLDMEFVSNMFRFMFYGFGAALVPLFILGVYVVIANIVRDSKIADLLSRGIRTK
jgi:hypothetical protein